MNTIQQWNMQLQEPQKIELSAEGKLRRLRINSQKAELRRKKLETREWIQRRGYWKPETTESVWAEIHGSRRQSLSRFCIRIAFSKWNQKEMNRDCRN
jgi:hypothetical protein